MRQLVFLLAAVFTLGAAPSGSSGPFAGRWDLTLTAPGQTYPSWIEVVTSGSQPAVRVVGRVASVHPAKNVKLTGSSLSFDSAEYFGKEIPVSWVFEASGGKLTGMQKRSDGVVAKIAAVPAPKLDRPMPQHWGAPKKIFNGKDLTGWQPDGPGGNNWIVSNGELVNSKAGANIRTIAQFQDFKLHAEYNCPQDGNSGVYLRGRYETQVEYEPADRNDKLHGMGAIYGFLGPATTVSPRPGQWESYDITLVGRTVTVVRNGEKTIDNQEIPGITGGALDSHEGLPGPLYIQGDHTGGMKYRNITIALPE